MFLASGALGLAGKDLAAVTVLIPMPSPRKKTTFLAWARPLTKIRVERRSVLARKLVNGRVVILEFLFYA